jgi:glutaredoxin
LKRTLNEIGPPFQEVVIEVVAGAPAEAAKKQTLG